MEKIFQDAKDLNVSAVVVYGKAADSKLYKDADYTEEATLKVVADAFKKSILLVVVGDVFYKPVKLEDNEVTVLDVASSVVSASVFTAAEED